MPQIHYQQFGLFHVITKTKDSIRWCTRESIPERLIDHLRVTRDIHKAFLHAFCILPNHLHLLLSPGPKGLSSFMRSFKSCSSKEFRRMDPAIGWQTGFYDERIRDAKQRGSVVGYIQGNAMKHKLVREVTDWPWTSLHFLDVCDPLEIWV
ncbi:MAG: transposase [Candidatus Peribacteraceae bacterium]